MTNENYISYLVGTANGYPSKTQRYLKMLFSTAGIAVPDDQISIPFDVDTTVNIKDKELSEQIAIAFQIPEELFQRIKTHLARETARTGVKLTQRDFVLGLIERALAEAEASLAPQEAPESTEEAPEDSGAAGTTPDASEASAEAERDTADIEQ